MLLHVFDCFTYWQGHSLLAVTIQFFRDAHRFEQLQAWQEVSAGVFMSQTNLQRWN